jgi:hypothetical protein
MSRNDWEPDDVKIIDPSSARGRELLDEAAHLTPDTQGDPPPAPAEPEPMKDETRRAFEAGFQWAINGTDKYGEYNGGSVDDGYAAFRQHQPAEATPARAPGEPHDLEQLARTIARKIAASSSGRHLVEAIAESLLAFPRTTPRVNLLANPPGEPGALALADGQEPS